ncbi:MAG: RNA polymerase sigma factor [Planctomycetes bacterium]|nr:RNA polymerase sigma factor [Planctomycetota bacterium]
MTDLPAPRIFASVDGALPLQASLERPRTHELRALFESERDGLFRFLWHLTGNANDAEDLLQETFLTAWRKPEKFAPREHVGGYLRRTAFHVFLNARRKSERRAGLEPRPVEDSCESAARTVAESEAREELRRRVRGVVDALPEPTRRVFVLFRFEGLACAEIAALCGLSVDAVEGRIESAMRELAVRLAPHREELPEL